MEVWWQESVKKKKIDVRGVGGVREVMRKCGDEKEILGGTLMEI